VVILSPFMRMRAITGLDPRMRFVIVGEEHDSRTSSGRAFRSMSLDRSAIAG